VKEHYAGLKKNFRTRAVLEKDFLGKLYAQQKLNPVFHLKPIVELTAIYPRESMTRTFALAREYHTFSCHFIRGLLEKEAPQETAPAQRATSLWPLPQITVKADLSAY
jgi:hypothetical protein